MNRNLVFVVFICFVFSMLSAAGFCYANPAGMDTKIIVPVKGTPAERVKELWRITSPIIVSDAKANYADKEYLKRRPPLFDAWATLQVKLSLENLKSPGPAYKNALKVIPEVLRVIDDLYGFPGNSKILREKKRKNIRRIIITSGLPGLNRKINGLI